jgi:hypothetical protein
MRIPIALLVALAVAGGCSRQLADSGKVQLHVDQPPHGGTPVALGEAYNLELVRDPSTGLLQAYVLDDEMEEFVRSSAPSVEIDAKVAGTAKVVILKAVPNTATGETVGDTSQFQGQADWLKGTAPFDGAVVSITVRGTLFSGVRFSFPKGNTSG